MSLNKAITTVDFHAIIARTDLLTGPHAPHAAKPVRLLSAREIRTLVTSKHPAVQTARSPRNATRFY